MAEFVDSVDVDVSPQALFDFLADVGNLPRYMPRITRAEAIGDGAVEVVATPRMPDGSMPQVQGRAWIRTDQPGKTFSWGAFGGRHGYQGRFDIEPREDGTSHLVVRLTSSRADSAAVRAGLRDVVASVRRLAESG